MLLSHLSVLAGTGSLMWLVTLALRDPEVTREPTPMLAADLTLFWAAGRVSLILQRHKLQHDGTS